MRELTMAEVQKKAVDILVYIDKICRENNLKYTIFYGSLIGVERHQGFIPWDDDLDIGMIRTDYNKFQQIFMKELGDKYRLIAPNYQGNAKNRFPKIIKKNTLYREILDAKDRRKAGMTASAEGLYLKDVFISFVQSEFQWY